LSTLQGGRGRSRRPTPIAGHAERRWALAGLGSRLSAMKARHGLWRRVATKDAGHAVAGAPRLWAHHSRPPGRLSVTAGCLDGSKHARHRCMRAPVSGLARALEELDRSESFTVPIPAHTGGAMPVSSYSDQSLTGISYFYTFILFFLNNFTW
jgi:hypothetical protein